MNDIAERRKEEKGRRRAEILDAAEQVTGSPGWEELTMEQVARRVRLSRALLYVYFKDKVDLMYALNERCLIALQQRFTEAYQSKQLGLDKVYAVGEAYVAFAEECPIYFDILARCALRGVNTKDPSANELACHAIGQVMLGDIVAVLEGGVQDGSIRADLGNRVVAATALWGFLQGGIQVASYARGAGTAWRTPQKFKSRRSEVIAESNDTVVVEGNHYFPLQAVKKEYLEGSCHTSVCPWKGTANYYTLNVDGKQNKDAAWYYQEPSSAAQQIKGRVAFWKGVSVQP